MSLSMYQSQVNRLSDDIARLRSKEADESAKAAKERTEALKIQGSISKSTSSSMLNSKLRDVQRKETAAAEHDKKAARHAQEISRKQRSLNSAQASLDRVLGKERKKMRAEDLRRLKDLESKQRSIELKSGLADTDAPPSIVRNLGQRETVRNYKYDVCLSFAGEERSYVEMVASGLKERGIHVFYDADETVELWGRDLASHLDRIYRKESRHCVMFISNAYSRKEWTRHERRSALARAIQEESEYILPARFDDTDLDGLPPTIAYINLREVAPATLVNFLMEKLGSQESNGFRQHNSG